MPQRGCYKGRLTLLQGTVVVATLARRRCYIELEALLKAENGAVVLQLANDVAAKLGGDAAAPATSHRVSPTTTVADGGDAWRWEKTMLHFSGDARSLVRSLSDGR
jgi:hypothetical protein